MLRIFADSLVHAIGFCIMFVLCMKALFGVALDSVTRIRKVLGCLSAFVVMFGLDVLDKYLDGYKPTESFGRYFVGEVLSYLIAGAVLCIICFCINKFISRKNK